MARTSKKERTVTAAKNSHIYSVGIYARLSVDNHNEKNESIDTQIEIAKAYMESQTDMILYGCYSDLGKTGTNFERSGFSRLMVDVRQRKVDCVIVKDFSRFGRNYIETGNYIQKIFPFLGVRFVAVTDRFDSIHSQTDDLGMELKNLANEMYARDIAVKVKSSRRTQWEKGCFTGSIPPYGYRTEWVGDIKRLFVEETTAEIVRELYRQYETGKNLKELVVWLYENKIHRPKDCGRYGHAYWEEGEQLLEWTPGSVKLILTNPVYMGHLVQGRTCGKDYKIRKKHDIASEDFSVKQNTHEAIITEEQFCHIAERFEKQAALYSNRVGFSKTVPMDDNIFEDILFCGDCGSRMPMRSAIKELSSGDRKRLYAYNCPNVYRIDGLVCKKKSITKDTLIDLLKAVLYQQFAISGIKQKQLVEKNNQLAEERKKKLEAELEESQKLADRRKVLSSELYLKYRAGEITRDAFLQGKEENEKEIQKLAARREQLEQKKRAAGMLTAEQNAFLRALVRCSEKAELNRELLNALIERIDVFEGNHIKIAFRFQAGDFYGVIGGGSHEK